MIHFQSVLCQENLSHFTTCIVLFYQDLTVPETFSTSNSFLSCEFFNVTQNGIDHI